VGGRIYTKRSDDGGPLEGDDLGAMWIYSNTATNPVSQIAALKGLELVPVDLLSTDTVRPLRACTGASSAPCDEIDEGDASRNDYRASRRCIHMLLEAAQDSLDSSSGSNSQPADQWSSGPTASLKQALDVVAAFAEQEGVNPNDALSVTDGFGNPQDCAGAVGTFAAMLEHHLAADIEHTYGATVAELDAKWYNYRLFDGTAFPPLMDSIDATIPDHVNGLVDGGIHHAESRGGYGLSTMDTTADVGYETHSGVDHTYANSHTLIKEGYDHIVNSILSGEVALQLPSGSCSDPDASTQEECEALENEDGEPGTWTEPTWNFTHPEWEFAMASEPEPIHVELNSPVAKITRVCVEREPTGCVAAEYLVEREGGYSSTADVVIMAVPLGVLQQESAAGGIELLDVTACSDYPNPACTPLPLLPSAKQNSIASTGFGNLNKLVLHYYDPCNAFQLANGCGVFVDGFDGWDPDENNVRVYGLARPGDYARGFFTRWVDLTSVMGHPVLVGYATGLAADVVEPAPTSTVMMTAEETLRRIFGGYAAPEKHLLTKWGSDDWGPGRYAQGSVPHWKPDNTFTMWDDVAAPIDNSMFFTGDHVVGCSNYPGYHDSDGDSCETWDLKHYCTPMGNWGVLGKQPRDATRDTFAVDGPDGRVSPFDACCACGGGIQEFGSMGSAQGTTHGALMAGRNTALAVMVARDQIVMPTAGGTTPRYDCADDTYPVLSGWIWKDTYMPGQDFIEVRSCDYFRTNPWACVEGVELYAVDPADGDPAGSAGTDVNSPQFLGRGPREACPVACGTCPDRACDAFPCKMGSTCEDKVSHPDSFTDLTEYRCDCGQSGYTGKKCDEDYRECYEQPCEDDLGNYNSICYDSHTNLENRVLDQDPPCVPEGFPYPANHTCYKFVPVGHYRCECVMDYEVSPTGGKLKNGYEGEQCVTCNWYDHRCSPVVIYFVASGLIAIAMCIACYKQSGGTS
jgi:hypothetical protein